MKAAGELWTVARCLAEIVDEVVFVGGMIRELLITDPAAGPARPTRDVDCIVNAVSWVDYMQLGNRLRKLGFAECTDEGAPLCRWVVEHVRVDVMPIDPAVLGFSNIWYPSAVEHASRIEAPEGHILLIDAVHFCATKIEAFLGRGEGDFFHHDMEDLIAIVDGRSALVTEIDQAPEEVRAFIAEQIGEWLEDDGFLESLAGHLAGDNASQARRPMLLERLRRIASFAQPKDRPSQIASPLPTRPFPQPAVKAVPRSATSAPVSREATMPPYRGTTLGLPSALPARVLLRSTNLRGAAYDSGTHVLTIEFQNGRVYGYDGVPQNVYAGLIQAGSHGRYFNQWIKDRYGYRQLR